MRELEVEVQLHQYLSEHGYEVLPRHGRFGLNIIAKKNGRKLLVEVKGDRPGHQSSPGTINVDVMTWLGH